MTEFGGNLIRRDQARPRTKKFGNVFTRRKWREGICRSICKRNAKSS